MLSKEILNDFKKRLTDSTKLSKRKVNFSISLNDNTRIIDQDLMDDARTELEEKLNGFSKLGKIIDMDINYECHENMKNDYLHLWKVKFRLEAMYINYKAGK